MMTRTRLVSDGIAAHTPTIAAALTCNVKLWAQRDVAVVFTLDDRRQALGPLQASILTAKLTANFANWGAR